MSSSSSESDEDYVPAGEDSDDEEESQEEPPEGRMRGRKCRKTKSNRKRAFQEESEEESEDSSLHFGSLSAERGASKSVRKEAAAEETKKKADDLWSAFKKDVDVPGKPNQKSSVAMATVTKSNQSQDKRQPTKDDKTSRIFGDMASSTKPATKTYNFAGEDVQVKECSDERQSSGASKRGGSLLGLVGQLGKKPKLSTLWKSKMDWDSFKTTQGITEELQQHNKDGYLEKQDFLARTDWRQFEREKEIRLQSAKKLT